MFNSFVCIITIHISVTKHSFQVTILTYIMFVTLPMTNPDVFSSSNQLFEQLTAFVKSCISYNINLMYT